MERGTVHQLHTFRPMSIVAKRSSISATVELLLNMCTFAIFEGYLQFVKNRYLHITQHYIVTVSVSTSLIDVYIILNMLIVINSSVIIVYPMHWIDPLISFFRLSVCVSVNRSVVERLRPQFFLPIFTKFCMRLRNVVASSPIVCERNRK